MIFNRMLWFSAGIGLVLSPVAQSAPKIAPVPADPLELSAGQVQTTGPAERMAILDLLARARENYTLRNAGRGYDLKVSFTVDSHGQTEHDGTWQLEDVFVPGQGLHWTAQAATGFKLTGVASNGELYSEGTARAVPLRLEEVRGILLHPLPSASYASRESMRMSIATFHGVQVTCVLLSDVKKFPLPALGRAWEESEECIEPSSGLLQIHSEAPGRYVVYDYSGAPQIGGHIMPRMVTVSEAGKIVSSISVEKLDEVSGADPALFVPTEGMRANGRSVEMTAVTRVSRVHGQAAATPAMATRPVCVFGMVGPTGQLLEAHSLQPSDANSQAAIADAQQIDFSPPAGSPPRQHLVFVIVKFVSR